MQNPMAGGPMGFGPMAARADAPQRLTMEDWMSRSAVFRQQHPELAPRVTAATTQPTATTTTPATTYEGTMGDRAGNTDPSRDLRSFDSIGDYFNDPQVQRDGRALLDMGLGVANPAIQAFSGNGVFSGGRNSIGPQVPAFGLNDAVADEIAQAAAGGGPGGMGGMGGQTEGGFSGSGVEGDRGFLYKGGPTKGRLIGPDPEGPDDGYAGLDENEYVIRAKAAQKYGNDLLDKINAGALSKKSLAKALMGR
jgi:hypothetical protein